MAHRLRMAMIHAIEELLRLGWSHRRIARELGVHRETVSRYDRLRRSKPAISTPGSDPPVAGGRKSHCEPFEDFIKQKLEQGLSGQRIFQDLKDGDGLYWLLLLCEALCEASGQGESASLPQDRGGSRRRSPGRFRPRSLGCRG
jgi:IS30 family transposase